MRCTVHLTLIISILGDRSADKRLSSATVLSLSVARRVWGEQLTAPLRWTFHANGQVSLTQTYFHRHLFCAVICFIKVLVIKLRAQIDCGSFSVYAHTIFVSAATEIKEQMTFKVGVILDPHVQTSELSEICKRTVKTVREGK